MLKKWEKEIGVRYWMVKQEPGEYSWEDFVRDGGTAWTGVRNYQARKYLAEMACGDRVLFYHSVVGKAVVGEAEVVREAYSDVTAGGGDWVCVDLKPVRAMRRPVQLSEMRGEAELKDLLLLKQSRLSVLPLREGEYRKILFMGGVGV